MSVLLLALLTLAPAVAPAPAAKPVRAADSPRDTSGVLPSGTTILRKKADHAGQTQCGLCHAPSSWVDVRFNHDRTGFPLTGSHTTVTCKACHTLDFVKPLPRTCVGCHRDVHVGDLGSRCEECHDTTTFRSRLDVDAHRRTNFPLLGAHAALPCVECHAEARERRFTRSMVSCGSCHQADYAMTSRPNHGMAGFDSQRCQTCHGPFRFIPAKYAAHDRCFITSRGSHAGLPCTACHGASAFTSTAIGSCLSITGQLQCIECHQKTHECLAMDKRHANIAGYSCTNRKCYECHQPLGGGP